jgi:taurine dioxygenase
MLVSNIRKDGKPIGSLPDGEMWFHHDMCYVAEPHKGTFLYAIEVPNTGGNTRFTNMYKAYDCLPRALKEKLKGRTTLQVYDYMTTVQPDIDGDMSNIHHYTQPIFITNPESGRKALYVNRLMTARIDGLPRDESDAILEELFDIVERPEHVYEHKWTPGDLVMWDNLCSCHARTDFPADQTRLLRRCTVEGSGPLREDP